MNELSDDIESRFLTCPLRRDNIIVLADRYAEICVTELGKAIDYLDKTSGEEGR